jgi:hypothetical protein
MDSSVNSPPVRSPRKFLVWKRVDRFVIDDKRGRQETKAMIMNTILLTYEVQGLLQPRLVELRVLCGSSSAHARR